VLKVRERPGADNDGHDNFLVGVTEQGVQQAMAWPRVLWLAWQVFRSVPHAAPAWVESEKPSMLEIT
jgi:hypothetical protein